MPQLDVTTFFSQFFWLSVFFLGFYGILVRSYLPRMSRLLKLRTRKVNQSVQASTRQLPAQEVTPETLVLNGLRLSAEEVHACTQATASWMQDCLQTAQKTQFQEMNTAYFSTLGQVASGQSVNAHLFSTLCSPRDFQKLGLRLAGPAREKAFTARLLRSI